MKLAIIGAGLAGRLLAWQLLERGHAVTLYDRDSGAGELSAGIIAAAMLAPYSEILDAEPVVYTQGLRSMGLWQQWSQQLLATTAVDIGLQLNGSIVVAHRNDQGDYQRFWQRITSHSVVNQEKVIALDLAGLQQLEPELAARFDRACFLVEEGCLDNAALYAALATRIRQLGGEWHASQAVDSLQFRYLQQQGFDQVVDCRGFAARDNVASLRGVRGEVIRVRAPEVGLTRPVRLMHPRYKLYIAPKPGHEYVIGATQIESSSEAAVTVRSSLELLSALYSVHSGFAEAEILSQTARCRPAFADNLPQLFRQDGALVVNGLYRHGYLLSPAVVSQAVEVLEGRVATLWPEILQEKSLADEKMPEGLTA